MKTALVIGGANGIGLSIATELAEREECEKVYIVDKANIENENKNSKRNSLKLPLRIWFKCSSLILPSKIHLYVNFQIKC